MLEFDILFDDFFYRIYMLEFESLFDITEFGFFYRIYSFSLLILD